MAKYTQKPALVADTEFSLRDGVRDFMADIALAQTDGTNEVEATPEIINHFMKGGLSGGAYFWYQGVKVYEVGKKEQALIDEAKTLEELTFPKTPA